MNRAGNVQIYQICRKYVTAKSLLEGKCPIRVSGKMFVELKRASERRLACRKRMAPHPSSEPRRGDLKKGIAPCIPVRQVTLPGF